MRTNLFKSLLVAVMAIGAMGGVKAQDYVTTKDNATDPTKQDVTYTFNDGKKYNSKGVLVDANKVASTYNGSSYTPLYSCTTEGLERLAFYSAAGTSASKGNWWWRNSNGLQMRLNKTEGDKTNAIGFLNLKAGNTINIKTTNVPGELFSFYGASSINSVDQVPQKEDGEANYTVTYSANNININVTSDGYVSSFVKSFQMKGYIQSITITEAKPSVVKPEGNITKVDGTKRVISLTSETEGASIYYTTDGSEPKIDSKLLYNTAEGITIDNKTTIKAIAVSGEDKSEVYSETFEAGTEVSLANPVASITKMGEGFARTYNVVCNNKDVLLTPTAKLTYNFTPSGEGEAASGVECNGTITATAAGIYVVTASAEGYTSTSVIIDNTKEYELTKTIDFTTLKAEDLSANWKKKAEGVSLPGKWSAKYGNVVADQYFYDFSAESASATDVVAGLNVEINKNGKAPVLFTGFGMMYPIYQMNAEGDDNTENKLAITNGKLSIAEGTAEQVGVYTYINNYGKGGTKTAVVAGDKEFPLYRFSDMLTKVEIYSPKTTVTVNVSNAGYATYATTNNVIVPSDVEVMTVKVNADNTSISFNKVKAGTVIPAKTGILVKAAAGNHDFVVTSDKSEESEALTNNDLKAATADKTSNGTTFFALTKIGEKVGFALVANGVVIPAGKAYLEVPAASTAKFFGLDGEATGINSVKTAKADGAYYTLEGVKTTKPVKGLYIHNGKKIVVK